MEVIINAVANSIITVSISFFIIAVFGSNNKKINSLNVLERLFIRVGLSATAAGALLNVLILSHPSTTEILLNIGLAIIFSWAVHFHFKYFINKKNKAN